jgi:Fe2+ or Zn2+ uptake regulation protein
MQLHERAVLHDVALHPSSRMVWLELRARTEALGVTSLEVAQEELCNAVGITPTTVRSALKQLSAAGLLTVTRQHRKSLYEPRQPQVGP